jgi:hypothetical protein
MSHPALPSRRHVLQILATGVALAGLSRTAAAAETVFKLSVRDQKFDPARLEVPAGVKLELHITNNDPKPVEFESADLRREKVIAPGQTAIVYVGPLRPGTYGFFDDFRPTTRGELIAR